MAGSADRHAWNGSVCGARAGCAAVSGTGAAATYLDPELALEDLLGVPPVEPGFPPFAAAERRRGDVRWLIWQLKPAATAALKVLNRWRMTLGRCVGAAGSYGGPTASAALPSACVGLSELLPSASRMQWRGKKTAFLRSAVRQGRRTQVAPVGTDSPRVHIGEAWWRSASRGGGGGGAGGRRLHGGAGTAPRRDNAPCTLRTPLRKDGTSWIQ